ncbi:lethal(3)malignant brain tumor-like protein 3 isoform X2 [Tigriopus californicus]|uniref:lethal(3)malignant brain tumor-like protein 3 isoform X2 n=1 Tax=Tigriopus californicus TaxID=6832 RepID=UPI0027D9D034|nr:lethal(3)malignant brain tumor-like protein 3 isoform X2 [Tigriopus californicus]
MERMEPPSESIPAPHGDKAVLEPTLSTVTMPVTEPVVARPTLVLDGSGGTAKTAAILGGAKVVPVQIQVVPQGQIPISLVGGNLIRQKFLTATASTATTTNNGSPTGTKSIILTKVQTLNPGQIRPGILQPKTAKILAISAGQFANATSPSASVNTKETTGGGPPVTPTTTTTTTTTIITTTNKIPPTNLVASSPVSGRPNIIRSPAVVNRSGTDPTMGVSSLSLPSSSRRKTAHLLKEDPSVSEKKASPMVVSQSSVKDEITSDENETPPVGLKQAEVSDQLEMNEQQPPKPEVELGKEAQVVAAGLQDTVTIKVEVVSDIKTKELASFDPFESIDETGKNTKSEEKEIDFKSNEFGALEIKDASKSNSETNSDGPEDQTDEDIDLTCKEETPESPVDEGVQGKGGTAKAAAGVKATKLVDDSPSTNTKKPPQVRPDEIVSCQGCGCYAMAGEFEFLPDSACSRDCLGKIRQKRREKARRERELVCQRQRREAKRKEKEKERLESQRKEKEESETKVENEKRLEQEEQDVQDEMEEDGLREFEEKNSGKGSKGRNVHGHFNQIYPWYDIHRGFSWYRYLEYTNAKAAPARLFVHDRVKKMVPQFELGMKLEAIDPEHPALICVVTIADIQGSRFRLHFDGHSYSYDFWENMDSPNVLPAGFCSSHGQRLEPPKGFKGRSFDWNTYLEETRSQAAPAEIFPNQSSKLSDVSSTWRIGMKMEAVDKHNASLVCVATVTNVLNGRILIHFDGWEMAYDYWIVPSKCPFIHPVGWCEKNGIELTPPKAPEEIKFYQNRVASCPVAGCRGVGHVKGARFNTHMAENACPYATQNRHVEPPLPDRIQGLTLERSRQVLEARSKGTTVHQQQQQYQIQQQQQQQQQQQPQGGGRRKRKNRRFFDEDTHISDHSSTGSSHEPPLKKLLQRSGPVGSSSRFDPQAEEIRSEVFQPRFCHTLHSERLNWKANSEFLREKLAKFENHPKKFALLGPKDLANMLRSLFPDLNSEFVSKIQEEEIDGEAFLLLNQSDFVQSMGFKLGPAVKLFNVVLFIKNQLKAV